jgi:hypothetical protein
MRTIERTSQFKHDYRREAQGLHRKTLERDLIEILQALAQGPTAVGKAPRPCASRRLERIIGIATSSRI